MASWVITISKDFPQHWDYAREHALWDMPKNYKVKAGDTVYFRFGGGGGLIGQTEATSDARPLLASDPVPWDDGRDPYTTRFTFRLLSDQPVRSGRWSEIAAQLIKRPSLQAPRSWDDPHDEAVLASYFGTVVRGSSTEVRMQELLSDAGISAPDLDVDTMTDDQRELVEQFVALREGQQKFRKDLIAAYGACAVTRTTVPRVLDAAHISDYKGKHTQHVTNGILLRTDLHRLFDAKLITIEADTYELRVSPDLADTPYWPLDQQQVSIPSDPALQPNRQLLAEHNAACAWLTP